MTMIINGSSGATFPDSSVQASAGKVLQVVNAKYDIDTSTSSSTYSDTGLAATITPKFATSKILVLINQSGVAKNTNDTRVNLQLLRGSTIISILELNGGFTGASGNNRVASASACYLDSPNTTSATTYKTQFRSQSNNASAQVQADGSTSTITLMEIAA